MINLEVQLLQVDDIFVLPFPSETSNTTPLTAISSGLEL